MSKSSHDSLEIADSVQPGHQPLAANQNIFTTLNNNNTNQVVASSEYQMK
jgi:hypothetical protein